jgi:hypothetical protein
MSLRLEGVNQLGVEQRHHVRPRAKGPRFFRHTVAMRKRADQMAGNQIAQLSENGILESGWFVMHGILLHGDEPPGI